VLCSCLQIRSTDMASTNGHCGWIRQCDARCDSLTGDSRVQPEARGAAAGAWRVLHKEGTLANLWCVLTHAYASDPQLRALAAAQTVRQTPVRGDCAVCATPDAPRVLVPKVNRSNDRYLQERPGHYSFASDVPALHLCYWCTYALNTRAGFDNFDSWFLVCSRHVMRVAHAVVDVATASVDDDRLLVLPKSAVVNATLRDLYSNSACPTSSRLCQFCKGCSAEYTAFMVTRQALWNSCAYDLETTSRSSSSLDFDVSRRDRATLRMHNLGCPAMLVSDTCERCHRLVDVGLATGLAECRARLVMTQVVCLPLELVQCVSEYDVC
jgi:hypothetical protein